MVNPRWTRIIVNRRNSCNLKFIILELEFELTNYCYLFVNLIVKWKTKNLHSFNKDGNINVGGVMFPGELELKSTSDIKLEESAQGAFSLEMVLKYGSDKKYIMTYD